MSDLRGCVHHAAPAAVHHARDLVGLPQLKFWASPATDSSGAISDQKQARENQIKKKKKEISAPAKPRMLGMPRPQGTSQPSKVNAAMVQITIHCRVQKPLILMLSWHYCAFFLFFFRLSSLRTHDGNNRIGRSVQHH
jgi:hypothetical protein